MKESDSGIDPRIFHFTLIFYCITIFALSSIRGEDIPGLEFEFADKIVHVIEYSVLYCLFFYSLKNQSKYVNLQKFSLEYALLFSSLYGITDEFHQYFVANRTCEFYDWAADTLGAVIMFVLFKYFYGRVKLISAVLLVFAVIGYFTLDDSESVKSKPAISFYGEEARIYLQPHRENGNKGSFSFKIELGFYEKNLDTNYRIVDLAIHFRDKDLENVRFDTKIRSVSDSTFKMDIFQSDDGIYINKQETYPEEVYFSFKLVRKSRLIMSVKTHKIIIEKIY